ncbi:MAG: hypothetical protein FWG74_05790, partial [Planctomycetes bacterium]|nr:hypothetical protein [Planctomycetota bacterium]
MMPDYRRTEDEEHFSYGRPTGSAWIAAVAVAFAVFILGGFIKTYRQLEIVKEESRREIRELRQILDSFRAYDMNPSQPAGARMPRLPQTLRQTYPRGAEPSSVRRTTLSDAIQTTTPSSRTLLPEIELERQGITYEFGRKSNPEPRGETVRREQIQVVSVAGPQRRLLVEGGRDI